MIPSDIDRQFCSFACYRSFNGENLLEAKVRRSLKHLGYLFTQECKCGRYSIDFGIYPTNIALEIDGSYWHRDKARDARKESYLSKNGWHVIRITEKEIRNTLDLDTFIIKRLQQIAPD